MSFAVACVKRRDTEEWEECLKEGDKLRWYRQIKSELKREDYLSWDIPSQHRMLYARLRSGTHWLRMESGRWRKEPEPERICMACITGKVESESHFLLDCYIYYGLRKSMFNTIKVKAGYDMELMDGNTDWQVDALLGHGLVDKEKRRIVGTAVSSFIAAAWRMRKRELKDSRQAQV